MASLTDDNEADGSLDKRNIWLIGAGHTSIHWGCFYFGNLLSKKSTRHKKNPQDTKILTYFHPLCIIITQGRQRRVSVKALK